MLYQDLQQRGGATDEHLNEFPGRAVMVRGDAAVNPRGPKALVDKIKKDTVRVVERRLVYACAGLTEALSDGPQEYMSTRHDTTMAAVSLSANLARLIYPLTRKPIAVGNASGLFGSRRRSPCGHSWRPPTPGAIGRCLLMASKTRGETGSFAHTRGLTARWRCVAQKPRSR